MQPAEALQHLTDALLLTIILSMPPIIVASVVGIVVSLIQALTQIQEQTVPFAFKLLAVTLVLLLMGGFLGQEAMNFTENLFNNFPFIVS